MRAGLRWHPALWTAMLAVLVGAAAAGCRRDRPAGVRVEAAPPAAPASQTPAAAAPDGTARDLAADEAMGGHTLARHVGKSDRDLGDRLRREPQISSASTYTDRQTAERVVAAAIGRGGRRLEAWLDRQGSRPNLVLRYVNPGRQPVGRSLARGEREARPSDRALVVLRWDERVKRFYVLTSYPEIPR